MTDKMREDFIQAFEKDNGYRPSRADCGEGFDSPFENGAWWAWKTSRATKVTGKGCRQQFDAYAKARGWSLALTSGFYDDPRAHEAWAIWLASRAACTIDLSEALNTAQTEYESEMTVYSQAVDAIEAAGVNVKTE